MIKGFFCTVLLLAGTYSFGQFGLYASAAYINLNGNSLFYNNTAPGLGQDIGSNTFQGSDFGVVQQNSGSLRLVGGEIKTFKGPADNVCSGSLHYTVYPSGFRPVTPVFNNIDLGFYSDCSAPPCGSFFGSFDIGAGGGCCSNRDQKWQNPGFGTAVNIDLTSNPIGTYTLEIYYSYTGEDAGNGCVTTKFDNNNSNPVNYTAIFTVAPVMPVSFCNIGLINNKTNNKIYWNTYSESNTRSFIIERSAKGNDFIKIGETAAAGFSTVERSYDFMDFYPLSGMNYYRIKMTEEDGKFQNSSIISTNKQQTPGWQMHNMVNDNIRV
jgi:hypothetical protein